ncbi:hypothetical protein [Lactiplantibacillus plantarum]|uniref:hypothetical protein n=1 Tax=Lactiplantibacillus plantarum TaxID=1590 RepID=UPI00295B6094|nr:hypothetical protein [Lactiplantibacillus plantarum]MDV9115437.1 hypothetical protein [Lactiplantibacillus plantarum]
MFFRTGKQAKTDPIDDFINSLDYWENINLRIALIRNANHEVSDQDAYNRATLDFKETESLKFQLEKVLKTGISN